MDIKKQFINKLSSSYRGEEHFPSSLIDYIHEFEEENNVKFAHIYIGYCKDSSWSDHGCIYYDYDCTRSYDSEELPEELDKNMFIAGIWYNDKDDFVVLDFYGDGTINTKKWKQ